MNKRKEREAVEKDPGEAPTGTRELQNYWRLGSGNKMDREEVVIRG